MEEKKNRGEKNSRDRTRTSEYAIDSRTEQAIHAQMARLAQSYVPEWAFHTENPDIGSVIALLFAAQLSGNIRRLNQVVEKYHTEFINLLDLSLKAAFPAAGIAVFELIPDTVPGVLIPHGVKLLAQRNDAERIVFETQQDIFVTHARLTDLVGVSGTSGSICPLRGDWHQEPLLPPSARSMRLSAESSPDVRFSSAVASNAPPNTPSNAAPSPAFQATAAGSSASAISTASPAFPSPASITAPASIVSPAFPSSPAVTPLTAPTRSTSEFPIHLFDYSSGNIARSALILYHSSLFDTAEGVSVSVYAYDAITGESLAPWLSNPANCHWSYFSSSGLTPIAAQASSDGGVLLEKGGENQHIRLEGMDYAMLCVETNGMPPYAVSFRSLEVCSSCEQTPPDCVIHNDEQLDSEDCLPFGSTASIFDECYIGHDRIFRQQGAEIELTFHLEYEDKIVDLLPAQVEEELKIIKRRPRPVQIGRADTCIQRVSFSYFNGRGWYRLPCSADWQTLFDVTHNGDICIRFDCPDDWQFTVMGGVEGRMIRMRVMQADNCFLQPCRHRMPRLTNIRLRYRYVGMRRIPQRVERICGIQRENITAVVQQKQPFTAFAPLPYLENSLLLGFDRPFTGSPVSLFFDIEENIHFESVPLQFYYSTASGFKRLRIIDGTHAMQQAGAILFHPPLDFAPFPVEGRLRYWLRLTDETGAFDQKGRYHAVIRSILMNAVEISNRETLAEQSLYIETAAPHMVFPLGTDNILSAEVFVNEFGSLTRREMQEALANRPDDIRVEYNLLGELSAFFVRWEEVDNFDQSTPNDRHYVIDRMMGLLRFGDGVNVMIPRAQTGTAILVRVKRCEGANGNLPAGAIDSLYGHMMYIDRVYNPIATNAGSNIETIESARLRGANVISAQERLVSPLDFQRAVQAYSSVIAKVRCIPGYAPNGRKDGRVVSIVVMMQDYQTGSYSFHNLKKPLSAYLLSQCEATISPDDLYLTEPIYMELSVDVWVETAQMEKAFPIQNMLIDRITEFLDPLNGWEIGVLPDETQIDMMLHTAKIDAVIRRFTVNVRHIDRDGVHICGLADLPPSPFLIGVNGTHQVHVLYSGT